MRVKRSLMLLAPLVLLLLAAAFAEAGTPPIGRATAQEIQSRPQRVSVQAQDWDLSQEATEQEPVGYFNTTLQGGEDIDHATVIPGFPFIDTGTTVGYADDYAEICPTQNLNPTAPDVVYSYTTTVPLVVDFPFPPWATRKEEVAEGDDPFAGL